MKDKTPFDFSFVFFFDGIEEGFTVSNASKMKQHRTVLKAKVYLQTRVF
ncbi:hypothetical protein EDF66_101328 [Sphingobacterium sp. JUb20]|nr:hypothetical protein [Sphingobacterium sp. JUb21]TCR10514.1 hypothetical protein EDF66_101328 [Sphingobacterium sp. JUb20]